MLQALDTDNRLDLIPQIWKGVCTPVFFHVGFCVFVLFCFFVGQKLTYSYWGVCVCMYVKDREYFLSTYILGCCVQDIKQMGQDNKPELLELILSLMAREKQSAEVRPPQEEKTSFCYYSFKPSTFPVP